MSGESMTAVTSRGGAPAHERYVAQFDAFADDGAGRHPAWLRAVREEALARFAEVGFPTTREEAWRFTDTRALAEGDFALGPADVPAVEPGAVDRFRIGGAESRLVFVNGRPARSLSGSGALPEGVFVGALDDALRGAPGAPGIEHRLARYASIAENPFTALNTAFVAHGAVVYVPRDVEVRDPIEVLYLAHPVAGRPWVWHPRNLYVLERGARATIIEYHAAVADGRYWSNAASEVVLGEGAQLTLYRIDRESEEAFHTSITHSHQDRDSRYRLVTASFGSLLARNDIRAVLAGEGAECTLYGLTVAGGRQHVDYHTTVEHAKPHCTSWEYFNGVYADRARGVFTGRIIVRPGAQKTDSKQTNNNLLLSKTARADSQPQLEIYADDVKCTHGATLGPIDQHHLFYLRSRGLSDSEARLLLTYGFVSEILREVQIVAVREHLDAVARERLGAGLRAGNL